MPLMLLFLEEHQRLVDLPNPNAREYQPLASLQDPNQRRYPTSHRLFPGPGKTQVHSRGLRLQFRRTGGETGSRNTYTTATLDPKSETAYHAPYYPCLCFSCGDLAIATFT